MTRKALSKRIRFEVFKRDEFTCRYCGGKPPAVVLNADHVIPVVEGGTDEISNLVTACFSCNSGKAGIPLSQLPRSVIESRELIAEQEAQERAYIRFIRSRRARQDRLIEEIGNALFGEGYTFSANTAKSCRYFLEKLPFDVVLRAAELASAKNEQSPFKYFCGVCWNEIKGRRVAP